MATSDDAGTDGNTIDLPAPVDGVCAAVLVEDGDTVGVGAVVLTLESMKTEFPVVAPLAGVARLQVAAGEQVVRGQVLVSVTGGAAGGPQVVAAHQRDDPTGLDRPDLAAVVDRRERLTDQRRPEAVQRRAERGRRTARANVEDLFDPGSVNEYGGLAVAAQRSRRSREELIERTPADGLICATGTVESAPAAVLAYDATVLAGTQGFVNHRKTDRIIEVAARLGLPTVVMAEGGGGRPGDVDAPAVTGLDVSSFARFAALAGEVPTIAVVAGYCFAGNAALAGCCDVIVATEDINLGMAGPAMIEGAGLAPVAPGDIGPIDVQWANGVVDVRVADEVAAVSVARKLIGLAGRDSAGPERGTEIAEVRDQTVLRDAVPLHRRRAYDVRTVLHTLFDDGSVIELRGGWAPGMVTALARLDGRPVGVLANEPNHLGGAIDLEAAASATRMLGLCERWGLPVVSLCDTPGFMVGPDEEARGQVRGFGDFFLAAARVRRTEPWVTVVLRKGYGLGAQAMAGGGFHEPELLVSWPTGEFGGMGFEGAVRLGYRRELDAIDDPVQRAAKEAGLIELAYEHGSALNVATHFEIDDVIDPADTRGRVISALGAAIPPDSATRQKRR